MMAAGSPAPLRAGHAAQEGPDRLELLTALIGGPSFDPLYRPDVIQMPGDHPVYPWECVVHACERTRTSGRDLCHEHGKQWCEARGNGTGQAAFLTAAQGLAQFVWREEVACLICLLRPAANTRWRLCQRHAGRWQDQRKAGAADFGQWLTPVGDIVPADARLLAGDPVEVDQSALTPAPEPLAEPRVAQGAGAVEIAAGAGEQGRGGAFSVGGPAAVTGGEPVRGLGLPFAENLVDALGDADGGVQVADLGLVMPEHGQAAVTAGAVQPQPQDLTDAAPGAHDRFPDVAHPLVVRVVIGGQTGQAGFVGQGTGDLVGERPAGPPRRPACSRYRRDELPPQAQAVGLAAVHRPA